MRVYIALCPGLNKPEYAVRNYDVAYYNQPLNPGSHNLMWEPALREAGAMKDKFTDPTWDGNTLVVDNEPVPDQKKRVWLLVDYTDRVANRGASEQVILWDDKGKQHTPKVPASADGGQLLFYRALDYQPAFEKIEFPSGKYKTLTGDVEDWNVSTWCTPEPSSLVLLGCAFAGLVFRLRKRRGDRKEAA